MQQDRNIHRQIDHKAMRQVIGFIALILSPAVWVLSGSTDELTSISISYWTDSQDVFVGALVAVGFFLSAYNGIGGEKDREYYLSKIACFFAICVAFFPTTGFSDEDVPGQWIVSVSGLIGLTPETIHNLSAILLFLCLIALMWFFSNRARKKGRIERAYLYRGIALAMVVGIAGFLLADALFWAEAWGLTLFGIGWLVAGSYQSEEIAVNPIAVYRTTES